MRLWRVTGFQDDEAPHWHVAFVEAADEPSARRAVWDVLTDDEARPDEVWGWSEPWEEAAPKGWRVEEVERPFVFVLGGGCR